MTAALFPMLAGREATAEAHAATPRRGLRQAYGGPIRAFTGLADTLRDDISLCTFQYGGGRS